MKMIFLYCFCLNLLAASKIVSGDGCPTKSCDWIRPSNGSDLPPIVEAGKDTYGNILYAGRAFYGGDLLPAAVLLSKEVALVSFASFEHKVYDYEVLSCSSNHISWESGSRGKVPPNAIIIGNTSRGEKLYMGRVEYEGALLPGKIHPSWKVMYVPWNGKEITFDEYQVLVQI